MGYGSLIVQEFPQELQLAMLRFAETMEQSLRSQLAIRREDFDELRQDLTAFQQRTELRFDRLEQALTEMAAAQQRTEERVEELVTAQQRTEGRMGRLEDALEQLATAQQRTEQRVEELAVAQQRTEGRMGRLEDALEQLATAQQRTERELASLVAAVEKLTDAQEDTKKQLGGLSMTVGYTPENEAYKALPALLSRDYGLTVAGRLTRGYVRDNQGRPLEVNILGTARRNGDELTIVGESKVQLSKNDIDRFLRRRVERLTDVYAHMFPVLVTHMISEPDIEAYAHEKAVALYYSYDF